MTKAVARFEGFNLGTPWYVDANFETGEPEQVPVGVEDAVKYIAEPLVEAAIHCAAEDHGGLASERSFLTPEARRWLHENASRIATGKAASRPRSEQF